MIAVFAAMAAVIGTGVVHVAPADISAGDRGLFVPVVPCRLFDTRASDAVGQRIAPLAAGETFTQTVRGTNGNCTIPIDAIAVALNVTAVNPTAPSFLTIWPADVNRPVASNLNWVAGAPPTPNKVDVKLSADGRIKLYNLGGTVDVLADVVGYYANHNHDDRYYTKAETDAALAGKVAKPRGTATLLVPAGAFLPNSSLVDYVLVTSSGYLTSANSGCFSAPVALPAGATILSVTTNMSDTNVIYNGSFELWADSPGFASPAQISQSSSSGSAGNATLVDTTVVPPTVDAANAYFADICLEPSILFYDMQLTYTFPG